MKMALFVDDIPTALLELMQKDLDKYVKCAIQRRDRTLLIQCEADVVKCMEVVAVVDKYNVGSTNEEQRQESPC